MKETIFYNRGQMRVIRRYSWLYQAFFDYGLWVFGALFSFFVTAFLIMSPLFNSFFRRDALDISDAGERLQRNYWFKESMIRAVPGLQVLAIGGSVKNNDGELFSQDNLLVYSGIVLPKMTHINYDQLSEISSQILEKKYTKTFFNHYFLQILANPLLNFDSAREVDERVKLGSKSLKDVFGLSCLDGISAKSFVCKSYLQKFLDTFYVFDLDGERNAMLTQISDTNWFGDHSSSAMTGLFAIYDYKKYDKGFQKQFCASALKYIQFGGSNDPRFIDVFRGCGGDIASKYQFLNDFLTLRDALNAGYGQSVVYADQRLNEYQLISLQQLFYKYMLASESTKEILQSYLSFLQALLTKESTTNQLFMSDFTREFSYWYNVNIIAPSLEGENSKISKDEQSRLRTKLLLINNGDSVRNIKGLSVSTGTVVGSSVDTIVSAPSLEELFKATLPAQFVLFDIKQFGDTLKIKGIDKSTDLNLEVELGSYGMQFYVEKVTVDKEPELTNMMNVLLSQESYGFLTMLDLLQNQRSSLQNEPVVERSLCVELKEKYDQQLISCNAEQFKIALVQKGTQPDSEGPKIIYTFAIQDGVIHHLSVSDKVLEMALLKELNFGSFTRVMTLSVVDRVLKYVIAEQDSGLGLKEQILVKDRFTKYLKLEPQKVDINAGVVKVYFSVQGVDFIATYDTVTHMLFPIALDFGTARTPVIVQKMKLQLEDAYLDDIGRFLFNPESFIQKINPKLVERYFVDGKLSAPEIRTKAES